MPPIKVFLPFILLFALGFSPVWGQDPVAFRYTVKDGLPSNEVYDVYEDKEGYLWFATDHGISRFDGYEFKNYSTADGLSDNTVFEFEEDPDGRVWMRCLNGSLSFLMGGKIHAYPHNDKLYDAFQGDFIETFVFDDQYKMYFTMGKVVPETRVLDLLTGEIDPIPFPLGTQAAILTRGHAPSGIYAIAPPTSSNKGSITTEAVACDGANKYWSLPALPPTNQLFGRTMGLSLGGDADIGIYFLNIYRIEGCRISHSRHLPKGMRAITKDRQGNVWLLGGSGMWLLNDDLSTAKILFGKEDVFSIFQDRSFNYWICTRFGVMLVRNLEHKVYNNVFGAPLTQVRKLHVADSALYVLHGERTVDQARLDSNGLKWQITLKFDSASWYLHDFIILEDQGYLIQGGQFHDLITNVRFPTPAWYKSPGSPWQFRLQGKKLLIAYKEGINIYEWDANGGHLLHTSPSQGLICTSILEDGKGNVWVGTNRGLHIFDGHLFPFLPKNQLLRERVTDLALIGQDLLVVATRGKGLFFIRNGDVVQIDDQAGLPSNMCDRLYVGKSGLWVCSNRGLSLLPRHLGALGNAYRPPILNFGMMDGLPSNKVNDVVEFGDNTYIATDEGLVIFNGAKQAPTSFFPLTRIDYIKADDRILMESEPLNPNEDNITFGFQGLDLPALGNLRYRYKLEGYDSEWRYTNERFANYYNLPPGAYTFTVSAGYPHTVENPHLRYVNLYLPYKLHETLWFQGLLLVVGLLLLLLGFRFYLLSRQRRTQANLNRLQAEIKALRSQMRPHFIFNALNSIQHLILTNDNAIAQVHLVRFAKLMRNILEATNHDVIPISQEVDILQTYLELEKLRFGDAFTYVIDLQQGIDWKQCSIPPMLLQPIVENAIWHGLRLQKQNPTLWLRFRRLPNGPICCEVEDNGIGRMAANKAEKTHPGTSMGLANIQERIRLINATSSEPLRMEILDLMQPHGTPLGTLVKLYIPA